MTKTQPSKEDTTQPDHAGHRERLKERFLRQEARRLTDVEILELLLTYAVPRRDMKPIAEEMLRRFRDLRGVLKASTVELVAIDGVSRHTAALIRLAGRIAVHCSERLAAPPEMLTDPKDMQTYLVSRFSAMRDEKLILVLLNDQGLILGEQIIGAGTVNQVVTFPREVMETALRYGASALIMAHNHPHGPPIPSVRDREEAERLREILRPFDIKVRDSIVVGQNRCFSIFENRPL